MPRTIGSVVIPAYNEGANITETLERLKCDSDGALEVVVVCNGCTDDTFQRASAFRTPTVAETAVASKTVALNMGDAIAKSFPRVYLDADVQVEGTTIREFLRRMSDSGLPCGGVTTRFLVPPRAPMIRAFYEVWRRLDYHAGVTKHVGAGFYALSSRGRESFADFPSITADDEFVNRLFTSDEKFVPGDLEMTVKTPRKVRDLIRVKSRAYAGNRELDRMGLRPSEPPTSTTRSLLRLAKDPRFAPKVLTYAAIRVAARLHARIFRATERGQWLRDESSRQVDPLQSA